MIVLDYRDSRPLYQQVKDSLRRMMLTGLLEPDEKLPSVRSLATQLAINPNTIQRAYAELEAEGYIYSVAGRGSFVSAGDGEHLRRIAELTAPSRCKIQLHNDSVVQITIRISDLIQQIFQPFLLRQSVFHCILRQFLQFMLFYRADVPVLHLVDLLQPTHCAVFFQSRSSISD